ncbi:MAG: 2-phosphosulfolactate phosphatase [candidate division Zixibacteria bacterium]
MIELYLLPAEIPDDLDKNRSVVIIDIFRATTSMAAALAAGAEALYPAGSIAEAENLKKDLGDSTLMAGERNAYRIENYDFGNSPEEMIPDKVSGRKIIFNSTNGTKLLRRFSEFDNVLLGSFVCMSFAVSTLARLSAPPVICCAGQEGRVSGEDTMAAGMMVSRMSDTFSDCNDAANLARLAYKNCGANWREVTMNSTHGRYLKSIGMGDDLVFCTELDRYDFVPIKSGNKIIKSP